MAGSLVSATFSEKFTMRVGMGVPLQPGVSVNTLKQKAVGVAGAGLCSEPEWTEEEVQAGTPASAAEYGWSAAKASRAKLDRLMQEARAPWGFDAVLVWKLDRWGRSVADCIRLIQELCHSACVF